MPRNQNDATYDHSLLMKAAGLVGTSAAGTIIDLGESRVDARVILDVTACEVATGDESYRVEIQVSDSATFASGIFISCLAHFGDSSVTFESADTAVPRRQELHFTNEINGVTYRYVRPFTRVAGTVATGINYSAYMVKKA